LIVPARHTLKLPNPLRFALFTAGLLMLALAWLVWFWWISLFTEALLVPWYCCGLDAMPAVGSWQRTVNDFFATRPGSVLPSVTMITIGFAIVGARIIKAKNRVWLPLAFAGLYFLLLAADLVVTNLSWALSNWLVGPRIGGIDAGYHRTWYGILAHLVLWCLFYLYLARAKFLNR
jgi:hypothetical protein